jgi:hypothetical protein
MLLRQQLAIRRQLRFGRSAVWLPSTTLSISNATSSRDPTVAERKFIAIFLASPL